MKAVSGKYFSALQAPEELLSCKGLEKGGFVCQPLPLFRV